jgi:hypothetical protein
MSVMSNLDYFMVGRQKYRYMMPPVEEPELNIEKTLLFKLGQIP